MAVPSVSVIMPAYNAERFIARGMASALAQSAGDLELIVVDDGSTDATAARVSACSDPRVRLIRQPNRGVSRARNRGLREATGDWVAFLDSDDEWAPDFLASMLGALSSAPHAVLAYCGWQNVGLAGPRGAPWVPPDFEAGDKLLSFMDMCPWPIHAALTRRAQLLEAGGFPEQYTHAEDYSLWLEVAAFRPIVRVPRVLAYYHWHDGPRATHQVVRMACQRRAVLRDFVARHPEAERQLGREKLAELIEGKLVGEGFDRYWGGDLESARGIFRAAMALGLGTASQWLRMLPAWLPLSWHRRLLGVISR